MLHNVFIAVVVLNDNVISELSLNPEPSIPGNSTEVLCLKAGPIQTRRDS